MEDHFISFYEVIDSSRQYLMSIHNILGSNPSHLKLRPPRLRWQLSQIFHSATSKPIILATSAISLYFTNNYILILFLPLRIRNFYDYTNLWDKAKIFPAKNVKLVCESQGKVKELVKGGGELFCELGVLFWRVVLIWAAMAPGVVVQQKRWSLEGFFFLFF